PVPKEYSTWKLKEHGAYILRVSCLGYETAEKTFKTQDNAPLWVTLEQKQQELKEVEIKAYPKSYIAQKDTITYDLEKVKDGTENNIGEVINKLPGLSVDQDGKVSYQGNKIDKLMVDGQDFFGKLQQMATQNLRPEMIAEAELLTNYRESLLDIGSSKTVLNLKTNDKYKGVPTGDVLLQPGLVNKYLGHTNLFRFSKTGNIGLIADVNNIGDSPMSLMDFIDLRGGISSLMSPGAQSQVIRLDPTQYPRFLMADQNIKSKANRFIGANITSRISDRLDLKLYSLYNGIRQTGETRAYKEYPGEEILRFSEWTDEAGQLHYNTTHLHLKYLLSPVSRLTFASTYSAGRDHYDKSCSLYGMPPPDSS
ncbi:MAG: carboxypeptidase-like regulatory domain-containing protein, partial [Leadbetterella sp.]|nr:carboxypeptidase-like regulatory domain-containing protein [Leadbetterella sp.]